MNKFIRLKTTDGEILVNPEYLHFVIQKDGVTRIQGRTGPADLNVDIEQSVEEVMARINGDSKPTDYPNVAPGGLKLAWTTYSDGETAATVELGNKCSIRFTAMQGSDRRFWCIARFLGTNAFDACGDTLLEAQQNAEAGLWEVFEPLFAQYAATTKRGAKLSNQIKLYAAVAEGHAIIAERKRIAQVIRERNAAGQLRGNEELSVTDRSLLSQLADMIEQGEL